MTGTMPVFDMLLDTLAGTYGVSTPMRDGMYVKSYVTVGDDPRRVKITGDMFDPNRVVVTVYHEHSPWRKAELAYHTANYRTVDDLAAAALDWLKAALAGGFAAGGLTDGMEAVDDMGPPSRPVMRLGDGLCPPS